MLLTLVGRVYSPQCPTINGNMSSVSLLESVTKMIKKEKMTW